MTELDYIWFPYIRPDNQEYDGFWGKNGFYNFEVGYLKVDGDGKLVEKKILSHSCDSIMFDQKCLVPMMDCVQGDHIRIHGDYTYKWSGDIVLSTAILTTGIPYKEDDNE